MEVRRGRGPSRYLAACRDFLPACTSLSVCFDASRVAGKEYLLVRIIGTTPDGRTKACWAPPQAAAFSFHRALLKPIN